MTNDLNTISFEISRTDELTKIDAVRVNLVIDGTSYSDWILDVASVLFGGAAQRCFYDLFTCTCGIAGCDGFHEPLSHIRKDGLVLWMITDEKMANVLDTDKLVFSEKDFDAARAKLLRELEDLEADGIHADILMEDDFNSPEHEMVGIPLAEISDRLTPYYHGQTKMYETLKALTEEGDTPSLRYTYEIHTKFYHDTPAGLAARMLNLGESIIDENADQAKLLSELVQILRSFYASADTKVAEAAIKHFRHYIIDKDLDGPYTVIFHTDEEGPFVRLI